APGVEPARDPYHVYLDSLTSAESRRTMRGCLDRLARLLTGDERATGAGQPWHLLRYEHTVRIRTMLIERGWSAAYVNKHLVALRRVLEEAGRAGPARRAGDRRAPDPAAGGGRGRRGGAARRARRTTRGPPAWRRSGRAGCRWASTCRRRWWARRCRPATTPLPGSATRR